MAHNLETEDLRMLRNRVAETFRETDTLYREMQHAWFEQESFYVGNHYVVWDGKKWHSVPPFQPSWRVRITDNRIQAYVTTTHAKIMRHKPKWEVLPSTSEEEDRDAARLGTAVLDHLWRHLNIEDIYERIVLYNIVYGTAFAKVTWNTLGGTQFHMESTQRDAKPLSTTPGKAPRTSLATGEIQVEAIPPHEIYAPMGIEDEQESPWMVHARYMTMEDINLRWPIEDRYDEGMEVKPETIERPFMPNNPSEYTTNLGYERGEPNEIFPEGAIVKEYWERPNVEYPKGRYAIMAGSVMLVYEEKLPFGLTNYPIYKVVDMPVPRRFFGRAKLADLIPLNKELNRTLSQMIESKNLMSKPKWRVPRGSGVSATSITSEPGEVLEYNASAGPGPEPIPPPSIPNYVPKIADMIVSAIFDVSGQHEVTRAQVPAGVESGVAIQFLQEQDDTRLAPVIRRLDRMFTRMGKQMLKLVQKHYKSERTLKIVGRDHPIEVRTFKGQDLRDNTDVRVVTTIGLPEGKAARQDLVLRYYQMGLLGPAGEPDTIKKVLGYLEFGVGDEIFTEENADLILARRENDAILQGGTPTVHPLHNPIVHIREHSRMIRDGSVTDESILAVLEAHIGEHEEILINIQAAAGPNQNVMEPPAGPDGGPPEA